MMVYKLRRSHLENAQRANLSTVILKHNGALHFLDRPGQSPPRDYELHFTAHSKPRNAAVGGAWRAGSLRRRDSAVSRSDSLRRTWSVQIRVPEHYVCVRNHYTLHHSSSGAGIARSVYWMATGWTTEGSEFESSPRRSNRFWGRSNLLSNGYQGLFPRG
jgi:hypothetical protein